MITFVRIDDRVIHGQIMTRWLAEKKCDNIIIVDEFLARNKAMGQIYKNVVPTGVKVSIYTEDEAINKVKEAKESNANYFVIFKSVLPLSNMTDKGCMFTNEINIGPASKRPDTIQVVPTIALSNEELNALKNIASRGIKIYFQIVPDAQKIWWEDIQKRILPTEDN